MRILKLKLNEMFQSLIGTLQTLGEIPQTPQKRGKEKRENIEEKKMKWKNAIHPGGNLPQTPIKKYHKQRGEKNPSKKGYHSRVFKTVFTFQGAPFEDSKTERKSAVKRVRFDFLFSVDPPGVLGLSEIERYTLISGEWIVWKPRFKRKREKIASKPHQKRKRGYFL